MISVVTPRGLSITLLDGIALPDGRVWLDFVVKSKGPFPPDYHRLSPQQAARWFGPRQPVVTVPQPA